MSRKHHSKSSSSQSRRFDVDEDRIRSSRTVIYEEPSSTSQRTLSSTIRQVMPSSSSSFYNTSTSATTTTSSSTTTTTTKSLTIRSGGKHSRAINSDIYSSEIVEDEDQDDQDEHEHEHHHHHHHQNDGRDRDDEILDEFLNSNDERIKRRRNSSSHSVKSDDEQREKSSKMKKTSSRDQHRSPSEEGEEHESQSEQSDEQRSPSPKHVDEQAEEEGGGGDVMIVEPGRSRFDDHEDDEEKSDENDDDQDDEHRNSSHHHHRHHHHKRHHHHHHKRSRRHSSSTPQSNDSKNDLASPHPANPTATMTTTLSQQIEMNPIEEKPRLPIYYPAIQGCRRVDEYKCLNRIEEGAYGVVFRAKDIKTGEVVALKRLKMEKEKEGFPITSLREICCILKAQHENVCTVREIVVGEDMNRIFIVMDYVEHDLKGLMTHTMKKPFSIGEVKTLMYQLLSGVNHLHDNWIIHRDLKTSNLLLSNKGILKIGDFGLAREYGSPLKSYTPIVVTLWYRAPELLLGIKEYSCPIDIWSVGAIFGELLTMKPLFPGKSELDQLNRIFKDLGTPTEKIWPEYNSLPFTKKVNFSHYPFNRLKSRFDATLSEKGFDLLNKFLAYDPRKRINASDALEHPYFDEIPRRIDPSMFPTWPSRNEEKDKLTSSLQRLPGSNTATVQNEPKPPSGGKMYEKLLGDDDSDTVERNLPPPSGFQLRG